MIEIDDAGWGSLVGGTGIIVRHIEIDIYYFDIIPIDCFQGLKFANKEYLMEASGIVEKAFKELNVSKDEKIRICSGYIHEEVKNWLSRNKYYWTEVKIEGRTQELGEQLFADYLASLGIQNPPQINNGLKNEYSKHFYSLKRWVRGDFNTRKYLCKTGWNSWYKHFGDLERRREN
jgi:hypothetical protein